MPGMQTLANKHVLITGGAGFIGSHLADRVIGDRPASLTVVDNLYLGREANLADARVAYPALDFVQADASDYAAMRDLVTSRPVDVVFNLAVIPLPTSLAQPRFTCEVNDNIALTWAELCREGHFATLIHFSSSEAYGSAQQVPMTEDHPLMPETPYAASKLAGDHIVLSYVRTFGIDAAIVRPFNNYGPRQNDRAYAGIIPIVVQRAQRGESITIFGDGEQTRDFIFVKDTAEAAVQVYRHEATRGQVVNAASEREISINALVRELLSVMGSDAAIEYGPPRPGDVRRHLGGRARLAALTGYVPDTDFRAGLAETVAWYEGQA